MQKTSRRLAMVAAAAVAGLALAGCDRGGAGASAASGDMTMGDPDAKVKMVEYASASCTHCATFNNEVFPAFKTKYVDTGKVHYTLKEFLTPPNEVAAASFLISRCAGKDKYFTVLDSIYKNQAEMFTTGDFRGVLLRIAQSSGMTEEQFNACVQDEDALKALDARVTKAIRDDKITATPTFFINGKKIAEGELSLAQIDTAVAEAAK
ncbi:thioredoxin domain-containing protein [Phenylobacterium sp.]|uniref:thioredoxin domain-containing protein n=1 Tax=Phenylobacterium sp. TaxID=1871053 RepID=UPI003982F3E2